MVDLCVRIKRQDLAEKLTDWFLKLQKSMHDKEKEKAREEFEMRKKNDESQKD